MKDVAFWVLLILIAANALWNTTHPRWVATVVNGSLTVDGNHCNIVPKQDDKGSDYLTVYCTHI